MNITSQAQEIKTALWRRGNLQSCLRPHQRDLYDVLWSAINSKATRYSVCASRRWNKTSTALLVAFEYCQKYSGSRVLFVGPVRGEMRQFVKTIVFNILLKDISVDDQPEYLESQFLFNFKNGSVLRLGATNNQNAENLRGAGEDLVFVDEAAAVDNLEYVIKSILQPMLLTSNGLLVCLSTPGITTDNYFTEYHCACSLKGNAILRDIYSNTSLTHEQIEQAAEDCGGKHTTTFRREYLAEFVTDTEQQIVPEWKAEYNQSYIIDTYYPYYYHFVAMDFGVIDQTAILFATFDFAKQKLFVQREVILQGAEVTVERIAAECIAVEKELNWTSNNIVRTGDSSDKIVLQTLGANYNYNISAVRKSSLQEMVSEVRTFIKNDYIRVDPQLKMLSLCLTSAIWNKDRTKFERTRAFGHADALAAFVYLLRTAKSYFNVNPIPAETNITFNSWNYGIPQPKSDNNQWSEAFGSPFRRKTR